MAKPRTRKSQPMSTNETTTTGAPTPDASDATPVTQVENEAAQVQEEVAPAANEGEESQPAGAEVADGGDTPTASTDGTEQNTVVEATEVPSQTPEVAPKAAPDVIAQTLVDPRLKIAHDLLSEQFEIYCAEMRPGKPIANETIGAGHQVRLWKIIDGILRKQGSEFGALFGQLLTLFEREIGKNGVLTPRLRYRFFGALPLGGDEARSFEAILAALLTVCEGRTRSLKLKQVDFSKVFARYPDKTALARVTDYFNV